MSTTSVHRVVIVVFDNVIPADFATPIEVFERTALADSFAPYRVLIASEEPTVDAGLFEVRPPHRLDVLRTADTIVVPGKQDPTTPTSDTLLTELRAAAARGSRIVSICVGAFVLAEAGLLNGLRATTHWAAAPILQALYPQVNVDADVLYTDNGRILTSAGAAAAHDLCLHIVRNDHGSHIAGQTARTIVMPVERLGGQAQFISGPPPTPDGTSLGPLLEWLGQHLAEDLTLKAMADQAAMSTRTLNRRFGDQLGTTPATWLRTIRVRRAQELLESTDLPIEEVARQVGILSPQTFRACFADIVNTSPTAYRNAFRNRQTKLTRHDPPSVPSR